MVINSAEVMVNVKIKSQNTNLRTSVGPCIKGLCPKSYYCDLDDYLCYNIGKYLINK